MASTYLIENLMYLKSENNFTQQGIAERLHTKRHTVGSWLEGRSEPNTVDLQKLSKLFKVSIDFLCMENLRKIPAQEIHSNYTLIQKRLKEPKHIYTTFKGTPHEQ